MNCSRDRFPGLSSFDETSTCRAPLEEAGRPMCDYDILGIGRFLLINRFPCVLIVCADLVRNTSSRAWPSRDVSIKNVVLTIPPHGQQGP